MDSLEQLLTREDAIDYVLLEASGVADPGGIMMTFLEPRYEKLLRLDSITCIIDAEAVFAHGDNQALNMLKLRQIGFADMVVLNKVDLVTPDHVEVIREWVGHHLNRVRIIEATLCDVPLEILLAVGRFDPANAVQEHEAGNHVHGVFERWSFESDRPLRLEALREMVRRDLPASVYRCKGIIHTEESPGTRFALQAVGRRAEVAELDGWGDRVPRTRIVAIGSSIDTEDLNRKFASCVGPACEPKGAVE